MLKRGDKGPAVTKLQNDLMALGYPLPRWGADGDLGGETLDAFAIFLREHGAEEDIEPSVVSDEELELIAEVRAGELDLPVAPEHFFDIRTTANRKNDHGPRSWKAITGTCLHQTACVFANNPERMVNVGAHIVVAEANVYLLHDFDRIIWHGNGWNNGTVGVEVNGLFAGIQGRPETVWNDPDTSKRDVASPLTQVTLDTTKSVVRWIYRVIARHGGKMNALVAHRQASKSRQSDPGSGIWKGAALPLMEELGVSDGGIGFILGGYAIPEDWDPRCKGIKY